jgi:hypothetical protein
MNAASTAVATIVAGTVFLTLAGCAGGPGAQAPASSVPASTAPLAISASAPYEGHVSEPARKQCDMDRKVPEILKTAIGMAVLSESAPPTGRYLDLKITEIVAVPGGGFSGPKTITVRGTLYESGNRIGSFTARRAERVGNHVCVMLANAAAEIGGDVRGWLASPGNESPLGDVK